MGGFRFLPTRIDGVRIIEPTVTADRRGVSAETYRQSDFAAAGLGRTFVQENQILSRRGVLRGLHFQTRRPQGKLVRAIRGEVFDVGVDLREGSPTFGRWEGVVLSGENRRQLYLPEGFAHGFLVLSEEAELILKCTDYSDPPSAGGLIYNDPTVGIEWPIPAGMELILSEWDQRHGRLSDWNRQ